jgi:hypothetical protein
MCSPSLMAIASVASTVVGTAGSLANAASQRSAQKKQQEEVSAWQQQQKKNRDAEQVRQEDLRQEADKARVAGVEQLSADAQTKRQADEEARLTQYLAGNSEASVATPEGSAPTAEADKAMLSGQQGGDPLVQTDLAKKISEAAGGAMQRIGALAKVSSFGESFGGLGTENQRIQSEAGQGIDMFNEFRRGNLGSLALKQAVEPVQVQWSPSPLADIFSTALSVGAQGLGNAFGKTVGGGSGLPATTTAIPQQRPWFQPTASPGGF